MASLSSKNERPPRPAKPDIVEPNQMPLPGTENTPAVETDTAAFKEVVAQSAEALATAPVAQPKVSGRGRGRPPKASAGASPSASNTAPQGPGPVAQPQAPIDISKHLIPPLILVSKIPARNTGIPELALTPDEAMFCAQSLNEILQAFVPDVSKMSPKTAAVIGACVTFGSIGITKYQIYLEKRPVKENFAKEIKAPEIEADPNKVPATDYFKKNV